MRTVRVFLSSPGDVDVERRRVARVIERLNGEFRSLVRLEAVRWESDFYRADTDFQSQIPLSIECDIVIGIFWSRLGSELPPDFPKAEDGKAWPSGTAYEILTAINKRRAGGTLPDVYVFRKTARASIAVDRPSERDDAYGQIQALASFWQQWFHTLEGHFKGAFQAFEHADELETQVEQLLRGWLSEHVAIESKVSWPIEINGSPFRGLEPFDDNHASVFFGRERVVARALDGLKEATEAGASALFIIGASGTGKSSLVRAGIMPRLNTPGVVPLVDIFRTAVIRPAAMGDSCRTLSHQLFASGALPELRQGSFRTPAALQQLLSHGDDTSAIPIVAALDQIAETARRIDGFDRHVHVQLALVIDQLEELFSEPPDRQERFGQLLQSLISSGRVSVIFTLRADLYSKLLNCPSLKNLKDKAATLDLAPPESEDLAEIVRAPAVAAGLVYEQLDGLGVDERMLRDTSPDMLPLLQFTLQRLFEERKAISRLGADGVSVLHTVMTHAVYEQLGGIDGAIDTAAEDAMHKLRESESNALPRLLRRLTRLNETEESANSRSFLARSIRLNGQQKDDLATERLVSGLVEARILLRDRDDAGNTTIRLAHERILVAWKRAAKVMVESREFMRRRADAELQYRRWLSADKSDDLLVAPGLPLAESTSLLASRDELDDGLANFIEASINSESLRHRREALRVRRMQQISVAGMILFAVLAALAGWQWTVATENRSRAEDANRVALVQRDLAKSAADDASSAAARADIEAKRSAISATRATLAADTAQNLVASWSTDLMTTGDVKSALALGIGAASEDTEGGRRITPKLDAAIHRATGELRIPVERYLGTNVFSMAISPDSKLLAAGTASGFLYLMDVETMTIRRWTKLAVKSDASLVSCIDFSPDGTKLAVAGDMGSSLWTVADLEKISDLNIAPNIVASSCVKFSPDGALIAIGTYKNHAAIFSADRGRLLYDIAGPSYQDFGPEADQALLGVNFGKALYSMWGGTINLAFSSDGRLLALGSSSVLDGRITIVETATGETRSLTGGRAAHSNRFVIGTGLTFSKDDKFLASSLPGKAIKVWSVESGKIVADIPENDAGTLLLNNSAKLIISGHANGEIHLNCFDHPEIVSVLRAHSGSIEGVSMSPDGNFLLTASWDGTAKVWPMPQSEDFCTGDENMRRQTLITRPIAVLNGSNQLIHNALATADGKWFVTISKDGYVRRWTVFQPDEVILQKPNIVGDALAGQGGTFSDGDRFVFTADGAWNAENGQFIKAVGEYKAFSERIVDNQPDIYDDSWLATKLSLHKCPQPTAVLCVDERVPHEVSMTVSSKTPRLVSNLHSVMSEERRLTAHLTDDGEAENRNTDTANNYELLDLSSLKRIASLGSETNEKLSFQFTDDGNRVIGRSTGAPLCKVYLWDATDGRLLAWNTDLNYRPEYNGSKDTPINCYSLGFSADGNRFVANNDIIFEASGDTIKQLSIKRPDTGTVKAAAIAPDGSHFVLGDDSGQIRSISIETGQQTSSIKLGKSIAKVTFSKDGAYIAVADDDHMVWIINAQTGLIIRTRVFAGNIVEISFSESSRKLYVSDKNGTRMIIPVVPGFPDLTSTADLVDFHHAIRSYLTWGDDRHRLGIDDIKRHEGRFAAVAKSGFGSPPGPEAAECDRRAAKAGDPAARADGVELRPDDLPAAKEACDIAALKYPLDGVTAYQVGRITEAAGDLGGAAQQYRKADELHSAIAARSLYRLALNDRNGSLGLGSSNAWLGKAAEEKDWFAQLMQGALRPAEPIDSGPVFDGLANVQISNRSEAALTACGALNSTMDASAVRKTALFYCLLGFEIQAKYDDANQLHSWPTVRDAGEISRAIIQTMPRKDVVDIYRLARDWRAPKRLLEN